MKRIVMATGLVIGLLSMAIAKEKEADENKMRPHSSSMGGGMMEAGMPIQYLLKDKDLGLTKDQQQQILAIRNGSANELEQLQAKMQAGAKAQAELMSQDLPNEEAVLKGADELSQIHSAMNRLRIKQVLEIRKILTTEQRLKMREKMKAHMARRGMQGERMQRKNYGKERTDREFDAKDSGQVPPPPAPKEGSKGE